MSDLGFSEKKRKMVLKYSQLNKYCNLWGLDILYGLLETFHKGDNFCDILFAFLPTNTIQNGKNVLSKFQVQNIYVLYGNLNIHSL